jgi:transcriptional regulator with PAS, ATPase and Fis domain
LIAYPWPGNVRELENIIERAIILSQKADRIDVDDLPTSLSDSAVAGNMPMKLDDALRVFTKEHITRVLATVSGDKKEAAKALGMGLSSLYRKLEELEITTKRSDEIK